MSEKFHENFVEKREKQENSSDSVNINDIIHKKAIDFYKKNQKYPDSIKNLKELLTRQNTEDLQLFELIKTQKEFILEESKTNIDKIRLENYERIVNQIKSNLINIQKSKDKNFDKTGKLIDDLYGFFGGKTTENVYKQSFDITKIQASQLLNKILKNINKRNLSEKDKIRYKNLVTELIKISKTEIKPTKDSGLTIEELKTAPERINLEIEGIKGEVNGIISGSKNIIVGTVDLLKFIVKYPLFKEYRKEINKEVGKIYNFCVENGITGLKDKIGYILVKEIERIGKLPKEEQAKEIGKISGNVIAMLITMKVGIKVSSKLEGATGLKSVGLHTANTIINGPEDYIFKGTGLGINKISRTIKNKLTDFNLLSLKQIFKLDNETRLLAGEYFLGKKLNKIEKQAIIKAHEIGKGGKYTFGELKEKAKILKEAGFNSNERKMLMEKGICGKEKKSISEFLYSNDDYEFLEVYKEILGENPTKKEIMGEGVNGIVLKLPDEKSVIKIRKPREFADDIGYEIKNHTEVTEIIISGKNTGIIKDNIKIPRIIEIDPGYFKTYYTMERIDGQTISSKIFRNEHQKLKQIDPKILNKMTDREIIEKMIKSGTSTEDIIKLRKQFEDKYLKEGINKKGSDLNNALEYMKKNGIEHTDLHSGNIMIDKEGNIYIIDFGTVKK